jgi:hypothetical protein
MWHNAFKKEQRELNITNAWMYVIDEHYSLTFKFIDLYSTVCLADEVTTANVRTHYCASLVLGWWALYNE